MNTYFTPTKDIIFRFTPEIYRAVGTATADKEGSTTGVGSNLDGDMNVRMKYAYLQYTGIWNDVPMLKGGNVTLGAQPNPFIPWEEDLYQYPLRQPDTVELSWLFFEPGWTAIQWTVKAQRR